MKDKDNGKQEPKVLYEIKIQVFDNGNSQHSAPKAVPPEIIRDIFFRHMMLTQDQIVINKINNQKVKLIKPEHLPQKLRLHS